MGEKMSGQTKRRKRRKRRRDMLPFVAQAAGAIAEAEEW